MPDIHLPNYYKENFFTQKDTLYRTELPGSSYGTAGTPIPYSAHSDNVLTALLLCLFIMAVIAFSNVKGFVVRQARNFLYLPHEGTTEVTETATEVRFQLFIVFQTSLLLALLYYFYTLQTVGESFFLDSQYLLIVVFLAIILVYFFVKTLLYGVVNNVFFDGKRKGQWIKFYLFIITVEGMFLFPAVLVQAYFDLSIQNVETYLIIVLIFVKLLTIYKCYIIFFRRNVVCLQIILYFCALEMIPLLALWVALGITTNSLKINY